MQEKEKNAPKSESIDNSFTEKTIVTEGRVPGFVRNRRFFNLVTGGGDMSKWCTECGGLCSNSNHTAGRGRFL